MKKGIRIRGPPGVGKSTTVWLWVCNQVREHGKSVLWIHVGVSPKYLRITRSGTVEFDFDDGILGNYIRQAMDDIVVIDGVTRQYKEYEEAPFHYYYNKNRTAVSVCSVSVTRNPEDIMTIGVSEFKAEPWSLCEYNEAIKDTKFYDGI
jgi:KaiC/GvpD/RAD55 family RecA-like ATPase